MSNNEKRQILKPRIHESVFIAEGARIYGDVEIGQGSSIWFNAVVRGDEGKITVGSNTNIQDNTVLHSDLTVGTRIGDGVTIGHGAIIRGCTIGNNTMIGMNATVMTNAEIGNDSVVGANTFVPYNKKFPPRSLIMGVPARLVRELRSEELGMGKIATDIYEKLKKKYTDGEIIGHS
ncbi:MAG: gamma carbonic anhydrase family protein [Spirochaetes bacterium]|nr:gamma carbonic anhydrase family protein [Spirochaetota bacterium]